MDDIQYKIIEFSDELCDIERSVDIIPSGWIRFDAKRERLVATFMPPPYDEENSALLHSMVKCLAPAPEAWPSYIISIRGEAKTYNQALTKLQLLGKKEYAFSSDSEQTAKEKANIISMAYKKEQILEEDLWSVPELSDVNENLYEGTSSGTKNPQKSEPIIEKEHIKNKNKKMKLPPKCGINNTQRSTSEQVLLDELLPVIETNRPVTLKDIQDTITQGFRSQKLQLSRICVQLEDLKLRLDQFTNVNQIAETLNVDNVEEKNNFQLPFHNIDEFNEFNDKLSNDKIFRDDIMASMSHYVNVNLPLLQIVRDICKKFMSREVILRYTAVKDTGKKMVLCKTKFFSCLQAVIFAKFSKNEKGSITSVKNIEQAVGKVINSAKDWESNRSIRKNKND